MWNREKLSELRSRLAKKNYKLTSQREQILTIFLENEEKHLSAEEVFMHVKKKDPQLGLATVYRTLDLFVELGLLQQVEFDATRRRYELQPEEGHHHHLICVECNTVVEFKDDLLEEFEATIEQEYDFKVLDHHIRFYGRCSSCSS